MAQHVPTLNPLRDVRVRDPAVRDQDAVPWRQGRFAERVRREWNAVPSQAIDAAGMDLDALAQAIHKVVGGNMDHVKARLEEFALLERIGAAAASDALVRPGAGQV